MVRQKIQASSLINRLQQAAMGEVELTPVQLGAINSLLDRSVPKLSQIQHVGDEDGGPVKHALTIEFVDASTVSGEAEAAVSGESV